MAASDSNKGVNFLASTLATPVSPAEAALYGDMFRTATERGYKVQTSGSSPDGVAQVIVHAMQARRPKARYLTGSKARTLTNMGRLPIRIQDAVRRRAFGLPGPGRRSG